MGAASSEAFYVDQEVIARRIKSGDFSLEAVATSLVEFPRRSIGSSP